MTYKKFIGEVCEKIRSEIFHNEYHLFFDFKTAEHPDDKGKSRVTCATIDIDIKYLDALITIYPELQVRFEKKEYNNVIQSLVHEMSHILTHPLFIEATRDSSPWMLERAEEVLERQTQRIANIIMASKPEKYWLPKQLAKHQKLSKKNGKQTKSKYKNSSKTNRKARPINVKKRKN